MPAELGGITHLVPRDSIGWVEILIIVIAGLFILGPERLPSAAAWLGKTVRQVGKEITTGIEALGHPLVTDVSGTGLMIGQKKRNPATMKN